jgi:acyl-coenzyme A thioesterase PaaI-like protein
MTSTLAIWRRLSALPFGPWLFSRVVCFKAPYFASISPHIVDLRAGRCEVRMKKRRAVTNHIGTVHAIAMCNMAELGAGTMMEASLPASHRWIPKGMSVEYLKKATSDLSAVAALEPLPEFSGPEFASARDVVVPVAVSDLTGVVVVRAAITMRVSPKKI